MTPDQIQRTYADLAELYERQGQPKHRDWFLVLAADAALSANQPAEADRLLGRLLSVNPHHFLKPFGSFAEALRSPDVQGYVGNLKRTYPPPKAEQLLHAEQKKAGGADPEEPPRRPAQMPIVPGPILPPREEPEVIFARVHQEPRAEAEPEPKPAPPPAPAPKPRVAPPPQRAPAPLPKPRPLERPAEVAARPEPPAPVPQPRLRSARQPESLPETSSLVPVSLFVLLLLLGLGLGAYALLRPFLPPGWLP